MINIYIYIVGQYVIYPQNSAPGVKAKLVTNSFAKRIFMQPVGSSPLWRFFYISPCSQSVLIKFSLVSPHVLIIFPNMFPIAPFFNLTCFGKCCPPFTYIDGPKGGNTPISLPLHTGMEIFFHGLSRLLTLRKVFSLLGPSFGLPNPNTGQCIYNIQKYDNSTKILQFIYTNWDSHNLQGFVAMWLFVSHLLEGHFWAKRLCRLIIQHVCAECVYAAVYVP